jgi:hypothetical protein
MSRARVCPFFFFFPSYEKIDYVYYDNTTKRRQVTEVRAQKELSQRVRDALGMLFFLNYFFFYCTKGYFVY